MKTSHGISVPARLRKQDDHSVLNIHQQPVTADLRRLLAVMQLASDLERAGAYMTNACEAIVFMVEGIRIELNE